LQLAVARYSSVLRQQPDYEVIALRRGVDAVKYADVLRKVFKQRVGRLCLPKA
jgi:hypothetical protein